MGIFTTLFSVYFIARLLTAIYVSKNKDKEGFNIMIAFNKYYTHFNIISLHIGNSCHLILLTFKGLNYGIDFKGGTLIELRSSDNNINVSHLRDNLNQMDLGDVSVKKFGNDQDYLIKFENKNDSKNIIEEIRSNLDKSFGNNFDFRRVENVGPKVSAELLKSGVIAIICFSSLNVNLHMDKI